MYFKIDLLNFILINILIEPFFIYLCLHFLHCFSLNFSMDRRVLPLKSLTYSFQISPAFPLSVSKCLHNPAVTWHDKGNGSLCQGLQLPVPCPSHADRFQVLPRAQG